MCELQFFFRFDYQIITSPSVVSVNCVLLITFLGHLSDLVLKKKKKQISYQLTQWD